MKALCKPRPETNAFERVKVDKALRLTHKLLIEYGIICCTIRRKNDTGMFFVGVLCMSHAVFLATESPGRIQLHGLVLKFLRNPSATE